MRRGFRVCAVLTALLVSLPVVSHALKGDLNDDTAVTIADAILALKIVAGQTDLDLSEDGDVDVDGRGTLGLEEAIFALRKAALGSEGGQARAVLGPLSGATVQVFSLNDPDTALYTTTTDSQGFFDTVSPAGVNPADYVLVAVSGGMDTDADDDGVADATPTANNGTIHALMTAYQFALGGFQVTALSDIVWQYTENLVGQVDATGLAIRLNDLAKTFFISDLNGDGAIDGEDVLSFLPTDVAHQNALNFDFQALFEENADGHSIIGAYHDDLTDILPALLEEKFWSRLTLFPSKDFRYEKVAMEVSVFGKGAVQSDRGGIDVDTRRTDSSRNIDRVHLERSGEETITFTATPAPDTEILSWIGCDSVSADKTRCECGLGTDRLVSVNFGYTETELQAGVNLVNLTPAETAVGPDQITLDVTAGAGDSLMESILAGIQPGDIVVSADGAGFLRRVESSLRVSDANYILTTSDAGLGEVVAKGTGVFSKRMTHGDLDSSVQNRSRRSSVDPNVRLLPSDDPNDPVFRFEIGDPNRRTSISGAYNWPSNEDKLVTISGSISMTVDLDIGTSYSCCLPPLEFFKFIPRIEAEQDLEVTIHESVKIPKKAFRKELKPSLTFAPITFTIGPVPVVVKPEVQVFIGLDGKAEVSLSTGMTFRQSAWAGFEYHRDSDDQVRETAGFENSVEFSPPEGQISAELKPYISTGPIFEVYGVTGPSVNVEGYLRLKGKIEEETFSDKTCSGGANITALWGVEANWKWDISKLEKLGKWTDNVKIGGNIWRANDTELKKWNWGGECGSDADAPYLTVEGESFLDSVLANEIPTLQKQYRVRNDGGGELEWEAFPKPGGPVVISPNRGSLGPGEFRDVTVTVNTGVPGPTVYNGAIIFLNKSAQGVIDQLFGGSTLRMVKIVVFDLPLSGPVLEEPKLVAGPGGSDIPSRAQLNWTYPDDETRSIIEGYQIYQSQSPEFADSWEPVAMIPDPSRTQWELSGLLPETAYYFRMTAYARNRMDGTSNMVSITTPAVGGDVGDSFTNSLGMTFVRIPAGTFMMGSPEDEPGRSSNEPLHQVRLTRDYYMMTTEVTQAQWEAVMGSNPSLFDTCGGDCPVESVSWNNIQDFIAAFNAMEGKTYRLPTEAEWEYAARAGTTTAFYNGEITHTGSSPLDPNLDQIGWYAGNAGGTTHPVAQKQSNDWGLHDISGNVLEWCQDGYGSYPDGAVTDPAAADTGSGRVLRGGSCFDIARFCRSADRYGYTPSYRGFISGFRLALSLGESCAYAIAPTSRSIGASGGTGSVNVTASPGCAWTAASDTGWISVTSGPSGFGDGSVFYSISANAGASSRTGTLTVAGRTFTVTQAGQDDENRFTNSLGMTFVRIPAGTFMMGRASGESGDSDELPQHQVTLTQDYYMMTTEVTQAQWEAVMGNNPSHFDTCGGDCPVEEVSWNDIQDFITALNAMEGKTYRLPTEAEWEYAARAGTTTAFYNGGITNTSCTPLDPNLDQIGWYCGNADSTTHPVAQKQPNAYGLYDMSGNVLEWCQDRQDWYGSYPDGAVTDPVGADTGSYRVLRGGSWSHTAGDCRSATRDYDFPFYRIAFNGFRLALSPGQ